MLITNQTEDDCKTVLNVFSNFAIKNNINFKNNNELEIIIFYYYLILQSHAILLQLLKYIIIFFLGNRRLGNCEIIIE
jgi:hypothetical protein